MNKLPHKFKPTLIEISKIPNLGNEKKYEEINKNYQQIKKILIKNRCEPFDMNKVINNYENKGNECYETIQKLKKLTYRRNKMIYKMATQSDKWSKLLKRLKKVSIKETGKNIKTRSVYEALKKTLKKYGNNWEGFWTTIFVDENGDIDRIELFDDEDRIKFIENIRKNT